MTINIFDERRVARRTLGGAQQLGWTCLAWCVLGGLGALDVRAQSSGTGGGPERDRVVALVEGLGGQIERDENAPGRPVIGIRLGTTRVSDDQLGELQGLPSLRDLDLTQTRISDAGLARLRGHEGLRGLVLRNTRMTDRGFEHLATLSGLEDLLVGMCDVNGSGLPRLEPLRHLKTLRLIDLDVTDEALAPLARLTGLERLELIDLKVSDAGLVHLRGLTGLKQLRLDANAVTDAGLAHLSGLKGLRELTLDGTRVTDAGLVHLEGLPTLARLSHKGTGITLAGRSRLTHLGRDLETGVADRRTAPAPGSGSRPIVAPPDATADRIRAAVARALPPLQKSLVVYAEKRDCYSCHHQGASLVALKAARSRGLAIDEAVFQGAVDLTLADLESGLDRYHRGRGQLGGATRAGYALWTLEVVDHPSDETTAAVANYLLEANRGQDHWTAFSQRVPMEGSPFTATAVALRGLQTYGSDAKPDAVKDRVGRARAWLARTRPADTEDRVFRLWGLRYADARPGEVEAAAKELLATQRGDGGWAQVDALESDAYATGSALVALHEAGGLATDDPAYRRGAAFLANTQKDDGTWFVASRTRPLQVYFESGFPYGKDQFISIAASGWAAAALALALPPGT